MQPSPAPRVSILIPCYRQAGWVARAIDTALAQDYPELEVIVSDDCSPDDTLARARSHAAQLGDPRLRVVSTPGNFGILRHYHHNLVNNASGEWVLNLDGDDLLLDPGFVSRAIALARAHPGMALTFADYAERDEASGTLTPVRNAMAPGVIDGQAFLDRFAAGQITWNHNAILFHRPTALQLGCYWDPAVPRNDWESFLRLAIGRPVGFVGGVAAAWSRHPASETKRIDETKYLRNFTLIAGVAQAARDSGLPADWAARWQGVMNLKLARDCAVAYLLARDYRGLGRFVSGAAPFQPGLRWRLATTPGLYVRAALALAPGLYRLAKGVVRR